MAARTERVLLTRIVSRIHIVRPRCADGGWRHHGLCAHRLHALADCRLCHWRPLYVSPGSSNIHVQAANGRIDGLGGYRIQNRQPYGVELCLLASIVLGGSSIPRALRSGKPVPTVLSGLAAIGLFTFGKAYAQKL